jgi:replicative DNA helicase
VNAQYVLDKAIKFVRQQRIKSAVMEAVGKLDAGKVDEAEQSLLGAVGEVSRLFDPGTDLRDSETALGFLDAHEESYPTGIKELDEVDFGPSRKELHVFVAPPSRGKSWWLIHLAKYAMMARKSVVHITLEMSANKVIQRYCQAMFAVTKRSCDMSVNLFDRDDLGRFIGFSSAPVPNRPSLADGDIKGFLTKKLKTLGSRPPVIVKQFPSGSITAADIEAYLDSLWAAKRICPDLLVVDYADLMKLDVANYRHDLGQTYVQLRGIAGKRNIAIATASQSNRLGIGAKEVSSKHIAEDISKLATADKLVTYSQTDEEGHLHLARLLVQKNRDDEAGRVVLISQNYAAGQFCVDSVAMTSTYWDTMKKQHDFENVVI